MKRRGNWLLHTNIVSATKGNHRGLPLPSCPDLRTGDPFPFRPRRRTDDQNHLTPHRARLGIEGNRGRPHSSRHRRPLESLGNRIPRSQRASRPTRPSRSTCAPPPSMSSSRSIPKTMPNGPRKTSPSSATIPPHECSSWSATAAPPRPKPIRSASRWKSASIPAASRRSGSKPSPSWPRRVTTSRSPVSRHHC